MMHKLIFLGTALFSTLTFAGNSNHSVGLGISISDITNDALYGTPLSELNDSITGHITLAYDYRVNPYFSVGLGYFEGDSGEIDAFIFDSFTDSYMTYSAPFVRTTATYPFSDRNSIFIGFNVFDYQFSAYDDEVLKYSETGNDFGFFAGWKHTYDLGIGFTVGYERLYFGDEITLSGANANLIYRF